MAVEVVISLVVAGFGLMIVLGGRQRDAELGALPKVGCGQLPDSSEVVQVEGRIATRQPLVGPVSGQPCAYFALSAVKVTQSLAVAESPMWDTRGTHRDAYLHDVRWADCRLEDQTGSVVLLGDGAEVEGARGPSVQLHGALVGAFEGDDKQALRQKLGLPEGHFDVHESHIPVGATVCARGRARRGGLDCQGQIFSVGTAAERADRDSGSGALGWVLMLAGGLAALLAVAVGSGFLE